MLVNSVRLKLALLGLNEAQIEELRQRNQVSSSLLLGNNGEAWIYAQVYEYESGMVKAGQKVKVTANSAPGRIFYGTVKAVNSVFNPDSRTLRVSALVENPEGLLRPETYVNADISVELGGALSVPREAVMDTGTRRIAFVAKGNGHFEPREVELGGEDDDYYHVLSGLSQGEKIVTSANFLIDSESKLKDALRQMSSQ
jgi:Cu(I)/Ag(I) efflux system membrane fusion protein